MPVRKKEPGWYFYHGYARKAPAVGHFQFKVRTFCNKKDYRAFILVNKEVLKQIRHEPEVEGFSIHSSFDSPYPIYSVALNTKRLGKLKKKYKIDAIWIK